MNNLIMMDFQAIFQTKNVIKQQSMIRDFVKTYCAEDLIDVAFEAFYTNGNERRLLLDASMLMYYDRASINWELFRLAHEERDECEYFADCLFNLDPPPSDNLMKLWENHKSEHVRKRMNERKEGE